MSRKLNPCDHPLVTTKEPPDAIDKALGALIEGIDPDMDSAHLEHDSLEYYAARHAAMEESLKRLSARAVGFLKKQLEASNAFAPINQLPMELLDEIFRHAQLPLSENEQVGHNRDVPLFYMHLSLLSLVCKHWKMTIDSTPSLWCLVSAYAHPRFTERALSSSVPLLVDCVKRPEFGHGLTGSGTPDDKIIRFAREMKAHSSRWQEARLLMDSVSVGVFRESLESAGSSLVSVVLEQDYADDREEPINLLGGVPGRLKHPELYSVPIVWSSPALAGLEVLSLWNLEEYSPSLCQLLDVLRNSPNLRKLYMRDVTSREENDSGDLSPIVLPHLTSLTLEIPSNFRTQLMLRIVHLSAQCQCFRIQAWFHENSSNDVNISFLDHHLPLVRKITEQCALDGAKMGLKVTARGEITALIHSLKGPPYELELVLAFGYTEGTPNQILLWLIELARMSNTNVVWDISLLCDLVSGMPPWPLEFLWLLQDLEVSQLEIAEPRGCHGTNIGILRHLLLPVTRGGTAMWLFPKLLTLKLAVPRLDKDALYALLRNRYCLDTVTVPRGNEFPPPASLLVLDLEDLRLAPEEDVFREMRHILEGTDIEIKPPSQRY